MTKLKRILIMAGGTGGHVFPGISVAKHLREHGVEVHWLGTNKGLEARLVPEAEFPIHFISISGIRGKGWKDILLAPWRLTTAVIQAMRIIHQFNPDVIIGMGGFVSGPGGIASCLLRKKLVIHEQNAKPGFTNKYLSKIATKVLEGFPNTFVQRQNIVTIGNPVRKEIAAFISPNDRLSKRTLPLHLLIIGGSQGAQAINLLLPRALAKLPESIRPLVWHQSGEAHFAETAKAYENAGVSAKIVPFIKQMDEAYAWADMVLCRAGALTIAELCATGLGAILVPYPYAVDDHQTANANFMVKQHAALLVQQTALTEDLLAKMLEELCVSTEKRIAMAEAAYQLRRVDATEKVLMICEEICH